MYRLEHPNPQFERESFKNLNGQWEFEIGKRKDLIGKPLSGKIEVPFCPESILSGIGNTDFIPDCVYSKVIELTQEDLQGRLVLHFGAVDYFAVVYVNGKKVKKHVGGYTAFEAGITPFVTVGENRITVAVHDDVRECVPSGKQSKRKHSYGCFYTRCTGIWQTVWLEKTPCKYIKNFKFYPCIETASVKTEIVTEGVGKAKVEVFYDGKNVGTAEGQIDYKGELVVQLSETHLWEIGKGRLYDVTVTFEEDVVKSYFGLREVSYEGRKFLLNGKSVFQRMVLDQGYYPDGIYTAKDLDELTRDIHLASSLGFNGIRLHQKVFEQRYLYECDKAGMMVWGEFPSWGIKYNTIAFLGEFISQWNETVEQYFNHPSIITWCPLNETWEDLDNSKLIRDVRFIDSVYQTTKVLDTTRPCVDVSGGFHGQDTDLYDFHCYEASTNLKEYLERLQNEDVLDVPLLYADNENLKYRQGLPVSVSEFGGIAFGSFEDCGTQEVNRCAVEHEDSWGYGKVEHDENNFIQRYGDLVKLIIGYDKISGFCYTQLYDIEQEQNGFFTYTRENKFSEKILGEIVRLNQSIAAIEK